MPAVANERGWVDYPGKPSCTYRTTPSVLTAPVIDVRLATLALYAGLIVGATFWGVSADIIGRRLSWNATLFLAGIFGIAAGTANSFPVFGVWLALLGFAVGGNLVRSAISL